MPGRPALRIAECPSAAGHRGALPLPGRRTQVATSVCVRRGDTKGEARVRHQRNQPPGSCPVVQYSDPEGP
ncbi:hypothetical protein NDU88_002165 [Pleurodeles waltl]|uniref:Uncharacterized protein n=1 Tax=Pleurodeles waltl TaxID=8319 RepID=A0AAV7QBW5_PLEWA|nr:hypothetical protein NDU88_002165 [Pleurodeles waltl]